MNKMIDLGEDPGKISEPSRPSKPRKYYPSMSLNAKHIKALGIKAGDIGDETTLTVKVRVSSLSKYSESDAHVSLEMISACVVGEKSETDLAKALYGDK